MKLKNLKRSKTPKISQLQTVAENLSKVLNRSVLSNIDTWHHVDGVKTQTFKISIIPGFNSEDCTIFKYTSWTSFLDQYFFLLKGDL